jgi:DNA-binding SARP family transcriptional activator/predicted ATPase
MTCYCLYLFGPPRLEGDSQEIPITRRKSMALVSYIVLTDQIHTRESLATLFWPELDQSKALANLRRELSELRNILGDDLLLVDRMNVRLNPDSDVWVDVLEFQNRVANAQEQKGTSERICPECAAYLSEAAALYTNDFLVGFNLPDCPVFDEWQFFQSQTLRTQLSESLQKLIGVQVERANFEPAIEYARRWLSMDTLHEPAHRQLMKLYAQAGQYAAALRQYQECERILETELGISPEEETRLLIESIRKQPYQPVKGGGERLHNFPAEITTFIGRKKELHDLQRMIVEEPEIRLVTILGPGGMGKTRLAIETARSAADHFPDGVFWVQLSSVRSEKNILPILIESLGLHDYRLGEERPEKHIFDSLKGKQLLLVMDNFEHLSEGAGILTKILQAAGGLKILVTSRERLALTGENILTLSGLSYPLQESGDELDYDAMKLFQRSIVRLKPKFIPDSRDKRSMARICQLVEGMPLALVLAAGWIEVLSLDEIAGEITRSLDILQSELRDLPARQRSMRAIFDYSWDLLAEEDRQTLLKCSVFQGGFTYQAAQYVAGASIKTMLILINKSWIQRDEDHRYQMHELIRQYAQARLMLDAEEYFRARERHGSYNIQLMENLEEMMKGPQQKEAFRTISQEFENILAAWHWLLDQGQFNQAIHSILPALFRYCEAEAIYLEISQIIQNVKNEIEKHDTSISDQSIAVLLTTQAAYFRNGFPVRFELFGMVIPSEEQALSKAWSLVGNQDDLKAMGFWGILLAFLYGNLVDFGDGVQHLRLLCDHFRVQSDDNSAYTQDQRAGSWEYAFSLELLVQLLEWHFRPGENLLQMEQLAMEALDIFTLHGDERETGFTLRLIGQLQRLRHDFQTALKYHKLAQEKLSSAGEWAVRAYIYLQIGDIYFQMGKHEMAFRQFEECIQVYEKKGIKWIVAESLSVESYEALRYSDIDHAWRTRKLSLNMAREIGDSFGEGWGLWELGEIYRVMGDAENANKYYEEARSILAHFEDPSGEVFYHRGIGDLALEGGDFRKAEEHFLQSLYYSDSVGHPWGSVYALCGLGRVKTCLADHGLARDYFYQALQRAKEIDDSGITLNVLESIAEEYAAEGKNDRAAELAARVFRHPVTWRETKEKSEALLKALKDTPLGKSWVAPDTWEGDWGVWREVDRQIDELKPAN